MIYSEQQSVVTTIHELAGALEPGDPYFNVRMGNLRSTIAKLTDYGEKRRRRNGHTEIQRYVPDNRACMTAEYWLDYRERCRKTAARWNRNYPNLDAWIASHPGEPAGWMLSAPANTRYYWREGAETPSETVLYDGLDGRPEELAPECREITAREFVAFYHPSAATALYGADPFVTDASEPPSNGNGKMIPDYRNTHTTAQLHKQARAKALSVIHRMRNRTKGTYARNYLEYLCGNTDEPDWRLAGLPLHAQHARQAVERCFTDFGVSVEPVRRIEEPEGIEPDDSVPSGNGNGKPSWKDAGWTE